MKTEISRKDKEDFIVKTATGLNEGTDGDGGYLVTHDILNDVMNRAYYESIVADKCTKYQIGGTGAGIKIPYCNSPLATESAGVRAYFIDEAAQKTISVPSIGQADITYSKLVVRVPVTEELRQDSALLYDVVVNQGAGAIAYRIDREILRGTDTTIAGVITGAGNNGTTYVTVASAGGTVTKAELGLFVEALNPQAYKNACWFVNAEVYSDIAEMNDLVVSWADDGQLYAYGFPVYVAPQLDEFTTFVATTTAGEHLLPNHMVLGDFSKYVLVNKQISVKESTDFRFEYDECEIRMVLRIGGQLCGNTMTMDDGKTYGWIVAPKYPQS